jgi:hypothetical protein
VKDFLDKHRDMITGTLSCFDRIIFKGHLRPLSYPEGVESFLFAKGKLIKDFKSFVLPLAEQLKEHAGALASRAHRPYLHLQRPQRNHDRARAIAERDGIRDGLVCVFSVVEPCRSFKVVPGKRRPHLESAKRQCLFLYFYYQHPRLGFIHVRLQTWFPFLLQVYVNGHDWLAQRMDEEGIDYHRIDNAFSWISDPEGAQELADQLRSQPWVGLLQELAATVNPLLAGLLRGVSYYWVIDQSEFSTDIMFKDRQALQSLYPRLLRHALLCFSAEDVLTFLGKRLTQAFAGEILNDCKKRWPGARIKHRMAENWIKMYDKYGCVLRIETVINCPRRFKAWGMGRRRGIPMLGWYPLKKRVSSIHRYAEISRIANYRYLNALAAVDDPAEAHRALHRVADPVRHNGRTVGGLNPVSKPNLELFTAVLHGEHAVMGFRNIDIRKTLGLISSDPKINRTASARVSRLLKRLHLHGMIAKIPHSRRWRASKLGQAYMQFSINLHEQHFIELLMQKDLAA